MDGVAKARRRGASGRSARGNTRAAARMGERWRAADERLVRAAVRWSRAKLAPALWRRYRGSLSQSDVDEIAASAVERGWECRATFDWREGTLKGWLWTIADHLALDEIENWWHSGRDPMMASNDAWQETVRDGHLAGEAEDTVAADIRPEVLQAMTECLPPKGVAVLLADAYGKEEVAESAELAPNLGVNPSAVPVIRLRAKRKLGPELERRGLAPKEVNSNGGGVGRHTHTHTHTHTKTQTNTYSSPSRGSEKNGAEVKGSSV